MRKVSVCTLTDLNPGFGGPWNKLWIFFVYGTFIMPQKKSWILCTGSKVPFWQNGKITKWHFWNCAFFGQKTSFEALWKCNFQKIFITCSRICQIQDLGLSKYKLKLFSKRTHGISKILFIYCSYESLASTVFSSRMRKLLMSFFFSVFPNFFPFFHDF